MFWPSYWDTATCRLLQSSHYTMFGGFRGTKKEFDS